MKIIYKESRLKIKSWPWGHILYYIFLGVGFFSLTYLVTDSTRIFSYLPFYIFGVLTGSLIFQPVEGDVREIPIEYIEEEATFNNQPIIVDVPCRTVLQIYYKGDWKNIVGSEKDV